MANDELSNLVKLIREKRGLTLADLSAITGIAPADLSWVERGKRPAFPSWRKRLAMALKTSEKQLFGDEVSHGQASRD